MCLCEQRPSEYLLETFTNVTVSLPSEINAYFLQKRTSFEEGEMSCYFAIAAFATGLCLYGVV